MFTFSFGSTIAWAGTTKITDTAEAYVDAAYTKALSDLEAVYKAYVGTVDDKTVTYKLDAGTDQATIDKEAFETVAAKVYADYQLVLADQYRQIKASTTETWADIDSIEDATGLFTRESYKARGTYVGTALSNAYFAEVDTVADFEKMVEATDSTGSTDYGHYKFELLKAQLELTKTYLTGELGKVALSAYSDSVIDKDNDPFKTTYKEAATDVVDKIKKEIAGLEVDETVDQGAAAWKIRNAMALLGSDTWSGTAFTRTAGNAAGFTANLLPYSEYKGTDDKVVVTSYVLSGAKYDVDGTKHDIIIASDETGATAALDAAKATAKAEVAKQAATAYQTAYNNYKAANYTEAAKATFDAEQEKINAYKEVEYYVIDTTDNAAIIESWKTFVVGSANWKERVDNYAALEKLAATAKITTDKLGDLIYDSAKIDGNMKDLKWDVYAMNVLTHGFNDIVANAEISSDDLEWSKEVAKAKIEAQREAKLHKAGENVYYAPEAEKVNALYDEVIAKIDAATTVKQAEKLGATTVTVPATIKTATNVDSAMSTIVDALTTQVAMGTTYVAYLNNGLLPNADGYRDIDNTLLKKIMSETFAEAGARTAAEAKTMMDSVYKAIDAYPTNAEAAAAVTSVETAIKALPKNITAADKEAVKAAWTAYDELNDEEKADVKSSTKTTLNNAVAALKAVEEKAITDAFKALPATDKLTAADTAAVEAAAALVDAFETEKMYVTGDAYANYTAYNKKVYLEKVRDAQKADVENQIYQLGTAPTAAQVAAARTAYDEFVAKWKNAAWVDSTDKLVGYKATVNNYSRLLVAEKFVEEDAIAAVEALKITASSTAKKGSITVKWSAVGDTSAADGYIVYKSTKANKGYKKAFTTTKTTYKNTKNLKKGTRYYYKVRAYKTVDGVTYYSDYSNKAYRKAK